MRRVLFGLGATAMFATGCATTAPPLNHLTVITPVRVVAATATPAAAGFPGLPAAPVQPAPAASPEKGADPGNWFTRSVFQPEGDKRKIYAVEILYCPTEKSIFTECRVAVAWSRNGKGGLGPQTGAPPSPVQDEGGPSEAAAPAEQPNPSTRAPAATEPSADSIRLGGKSYLTIPGSDLAKLRTWTKKPVALSLTYGKTTTGLLKSVDAAGLQLERASDTVVYRWDEIQAASPQ
jgi:hypothetical protein